MRLCAVRPKGLSPIDPSLGSSTCRRRRRRLCCRPSKGEEEGFLFSLSAFGGWARERGLLSGPGLLFLSLYVPGCSPSPPPYPLPSLWFGVCPPPEGTLSSSSSSSAIPLKVSPALVSRSLLGSLSPRRHSSVETPFRTGLWRPLWRADRKGRLPQVSPLPQYLPSRGRPEEDKEPLAWKRKRGRKEAKKRNQEASLLLPPPPLFPPFFVALLLSNPRIPLPRRQLAGPLLHPDHWHRFSGRGSQSRSPGPALLLPEGPPCPRGSVSRAKLSSWALASKVE